MNWEDVTYSNDFLKDVEIRVTYLINMPDKGILQLIEVEKLKWTFFSDGMCKRWKWYFKYRAALLQIKYPKYEVELKYSTSDVNDVIQEINVIQRRILAKKRKISEYHNKAKNFKDSQSELFPVEDHPVYVRLKFIEHSKTQELEALQNKLYKLQLKRNRNQK